MFMLRMSTAALLILSAAPVSAQPFPLQPVAQPKVSVAFGDLNLARPGDAAILSSRIQAAARSVCLISNGEDRTPQMVFVANALIQECVNASTQRAMVTVEHKIAEAVLATPKLASEAP